MRATTWYSSNMGSYMTVREAAVAMGISARALRNRIERGEVRAERVGPRLLLIPHDEVERWRGRGTLKPGPRSKQESGGARKETG